MTTCDVPLIRVSNPGDLIETVPYLMGFHPTESLALVGFAGDPSGRLHQVTVTMRLDLPDDLEELTDLGAPVEAFTASQTESVVAIVHTERVSGDPRTMPKLCALRDLFFDELAAMGLQVADVLVATGSRWWSMCCDRVECCPAEGTARSPGSSSVAAEATYAGLVALPDRQALAATLVGAPIEERARLEPLLGSAVRRLDAAAHPAGRRRLLRTDLAAILRRARKEQPTVPDRQLARFAVALTELAVRDAVWLAVDDRTMDGGLLYQLHTRLPVGYTAAPLFLYGWVQWRAGNGTLAVMTAERALAADPGYSAAELLIETVQRGLNPASTPPLSRLAPAGRWPGRRR
ncbi:MAG TPA: DUF4192 domain-containing protein [Jatrophihabitans sp.]|nr:DUF4192 domain-containing protein [Jatrophihabitans sp.]